MSKKLPRKPKPLWRSIIEAFSGPIAVLFTIFILAPLLFEIYLNSFVNPAKCGRQIGFFRKVVCGISQTYAEHAPYMRSLPTDEEMIEHFRRHRGDFELLAAIFQQFNPADGEARGRIEKLRNRLNITRILAFRPHERYRYLGSNGKFETRVEGERVAPDPEARSFRALRFRYAHAPVKTSDGFDLHKGYYYTPFVPKVRHGRLDTPDSSGWVFPSLNRLPSELLPTTCVSRQFEPQWFVVICH